MARHPRRTPARQITARQPGTHLVNKPRLVHRPHAVPIHRHLMRLDPTLVRRAPAGPLHHIAATNTSNPVRVTPSTPPTDIDSPDGMRQPRVRRRWIRVGILSLLMVHWKARPAPLRLGRAPSFTGDDTHSSTTTPGRSTAAAHTAGNGSSTPDATDQGGRAHSPPPCAPTAPQRCRTPRDGGGAHTPTRCG